MRFLRRRPALFVLAVSAVLAAGMAARADVIHLTSGGKYRGKIVKETPREVTIQTAGGEIVVPRNTIETIERDSSDATEFKTREKEAQRSGDPDQHYELGVWARLKGMDAEAKRCFERAVALDAFHRGAREGLGHRYHQGRWYTEDEYRKAVGGLVEWEGRWVTPEERERLEQGFVKDAKGAWVRAEDVARAEEEARLAREAANPPAAGEAPKGGAPAAGGKAGGFQPPPPDPNKPEEDTSWYRDNTRTGDFAAAPVVESQHYKIKTNAKAEYAKRYGEMMDRYYLRFLKIFKDFLPNGQIPKSDIWIYSSQPEFASAEGMSEGVGGFYSTGTKRVTAFHGLFGMTGTTREVLAHEGTHQFQDIVLGGGGFRNAPIWILEGLAVFFESAYDDGKEVVIGLVPRDRLAVLKRGLETNTLIPLSDLIRTPQPRFTAYHYAHAWGLIYMILYYGESASVRKKTQQWFSDLFTAAKTGPVSAETVEQRCGGREKFLELEATWKEWLKTLPYDYDPRKN